AMARLEAAKRRAARPTAAASEIPPLVQPPIARPQAPPRPIPPPRSGTMDDEQFARLLAAKRRAKREEK
ncbi:MAG: hypothetical protein H7Z42_22725, partial [Roseiflexaceae bacterium]|nr:hypothetical protein [Roseiflexaceae bacterium]